ncbi:MAG TPA: hypothetical protein VN577_14765, partial [Terriglobales bacterium]|nr:hypothetical protein [Terriglobales bacterium]
WFREVTFNRFAGTDASRPSGLMPMTALLCLCGAPLWRGLGGVQAGRTKYARVRYRCTLEQSTPLRGLSRAAAVGLHDFDLLQCQITNLASALPYLSGDALQPRPKAPELIPIDSGHILCFHGGSAVNVELYQRGTLFLVQVHQAMAESGMGVFPLLFFLLGSVQRDVARRNCQKARLPLMRGYH